MAMNMNATREQAVINITPMIDILLVLLIIFMAIAPQQAVGLDALIPNSQQTASGGAPENPVVLEIDSRGDYRLNSTPVDPTNLAPRLTAIYALRAQRILFLKATPGLEFHTVATAIDIAHAAAIDRVALMPR